MDREHGKERVLSRYRTLVATLKYHTDRNRDQDLIEIQYYTRRLAVLRDQFPDIIKEAETNDINTIR